MKKLMRNTFIFFFAVLLFSCTDAGNTSSTENTDTTVISAPVISNPLTKEDLAGCYSQIYESDTSLLQLQIAEDSLTGELVYKLFEKDRNNGFFKGELKNGLLRGWYYFKSEGIMSVREVIWKANANQLWPAMGEMVIRNDTMIFVNPDLIKYDSTHPFLKTACTE